VPVSEQHEMILRGCVESGAQEWFCPTCGRRELLQWPPSYERVVHQADVLTAIHFGAKDGVPVSAITDQQPLGSDVPPAERQWLWDIGIDWAGLSA